VDRAQSRGHSHEIAPAQRRQIPRIRRRDGDRRRRFLAVEPSRVLSQGVAMVKVDVSLVAKGYRASKLIGSGVVNDKNEKIGTLDDIIIDHSRVMAGVLQVGGFLGIGSRRVAVPYEDLQIDDTGRKIVLPEATREELQKLAEFKYES
jgi:sporulation protein YlmC with PRC-barrel domain